ncbi:MAG: hypothetical protein A2Y81_06945 [Nitrospirae bacterium RBG_13_43_8]|nr:MAG: hypothetical protein A2Y81_06945 [Nitrospirae bacterium RBG_13_43_8]
MKKSVFLIISVSLFVAFFSLNDSDAAMTDYCAVPPYVIQDVPPNVMIVLDNSGSMHGFAYYDGMDTADISDDKICDIGSGSDYPCTCTNDPCTDFDPAHEYYGYFNPDYWYTYSTNRFVPSAPKTAARPASSWDGNFLNWLTMRRVDVIRKVMTGGRFTSGEGSGFNRLVGEKADETRRGIYKRIGTAENYTPYTGTRKFVFSTGSSSPSTFTVRNAADTGNEATFNVYIKVPLPVEGVLQNVVGTRARLGLSFYQGSSGGYVQVSVAAASLASAVNQINLTPPNANTPLGEALWSMAGYFAQESSISPIGSPGPRYASGDYQINNTNDPLNYGTGGQPRFPACSKSFILYITDGEPCADGNLPANLENYATGRSDYDCVDTNCPAAGPFAGGAIQSICSVGDDVAGFEDVALWMHTTDLRNYNGTPDVGKDNISGMQNLTLYTIFAFGRGSTLLKYATINGGFEDANGNNQPDLESEWNQDGDTEHKPDNYYEATEGNELEESIRAAFESILKRAASGTAASVLASGEGSGANLIQAVFYPRRRFGNDIIAWTGESQNFWYYADPYFVCSNIREDTTQDNPDSILNLSNDYIAEFYFDTVSQLTKARRFLDSNGDGCKDTPGTPSDTIVFENLINLWEAGELLWSRDISTDPRTIYTTTDGSTFLTGNFDPTNASTLRQYLDVANDTISAEVIRYMHGEGLTTLRDEDGNILTPPGPGVDRKGTCSVTMSTSCTFDSDCPSGETCVPDSIDDYRGRYAMILGVTNVWKLGDILDSTPRISSWIQLNSYDSRYDDTTYSSFINTSGYKSRGMVFTGGNDGMLHAFKLGTLELSWSGMGGAEKAKLSGTDLGKEIWAFIPKNALPYLKYFMDPEYCHVFTVDLSPFIFDASIGAPGSGDISGDTRAVSSWRTILIGGMRFGGACRGTSTACADVSGDGSKDCVNTPVDVSGSSLGYSSYFALDITDTDNPQLLWEFSHPQLGFTTTGPAVVRIGTGASQTTPDTKNGKWFAVFGSGPTGPIDTTNLQFMGRSDQNLRLFVLDLKTGALATGYPKDTGNAYAFAGSMLASPIDPDNDYQDDAVYIGYVKRAGSNPNYTWTDGGVGRLLTKEDTTPDNWVWSNVIDGIGAVSASVTKLQKNQGCFNQANEEGCLWLYFGTGRYYFEQGTTVDDPDSQRRLYGIKEPCFNATGFNASCTTSPTPSPPPVGTLTNVTDIGNVPTEDTANSASFNGWSLNLDSCTDSSGNPVTCNSSAYYRAERVITDPAALPTAGIVFFTTFKPYNDECGLGGKSFVWAVRYNTGGAPSVSLLKGVALLQVSTGSIEQMNLSTAFGEKGGRRSSSMEGVPPTSMGLSLLSAPPPAKRVLHIRER